MAYGEELERVEMFKYLGRLMAMDDNDVPAVRSNIKKARGCWARISISRVLRAENTNPRVAGMFYKAVVQAILLFGSETWSLTPSARKQLEGFHVRCAWRMAKVHVPRQDPEDNTKWIYPDTKEVLKEVGLHSIEHYIKVRRDTVAAYVRDRPTYTLCMEAERRRGSSNRQFWWEQPMNLDEASDEEV